MSFTEQWFGQDSQDNLAFLAYTQRKVPGALIEIGSWEGRSTVAFANAANPRTVHAVDTWAGSPGEVSAELAAERDVFATFTANIAELTDGNVEVHRMGWREYVPTISEPVSLVFIDAEHTYIEVRDAIAALLPLLAPGGVICGDDVHHPPVIKAVCELLDPAQVEVKATLWIWRNPT